MFSDIGQVRAELANRLSRSALRSSAWKVQPNLVEPPNEYHQPILTFEFKRFTSTVNGEPLGTGYIGAEVDLVLGAKSTTTAGENDVDVLALDLIRVIDEQDDIFWSDADKERFAAGQWVWRIHTVVLTNYIKEQ